MTNEEIFKKAIKKAYPVGVTGRVGAWLMAIDVGEHLTEIDKAGLIQAILFSHDFAKAFWGIETINVRFSQMTPDEIKDNIWTEFPLWKWHLQQMVLEEHPIKYLEKFL